MQKKNNFNFKLFLATRKYLALSIFCVVVATLFLLFLAYPRINELTSLNKKIHSENKKLEKYQIKIKELEQVTSLEEFKNKAAIEQVLPSYNPMLELLTNLNKTAANTQIFLDDFNLKPGKVASQGAVIVEEKNNKEGYSTMDISFTAKGQLDALDNFLEAVEKMSPITSIKTISLQRKEKEKGGETTISASADLILTTHYYTQSIKSSLEAPLPKIGAKELEIFATILEFKDSDLKKQNEVMDGGNENIFGIDNWKKLEEKAEQEAKSQLREYMEEN